MRTIFELFAKSPFEPLTEHTERVHQTALLIRPLFEAFLSEEWERTEEIYRQISKLEHKADLQKNEIRDHLPRSVFLPVDRGDVLRFLKEQDGIADAAEDVAVLLTLRRTPAPAGLREQILALVDEVIRTSELLLQAARELTGLVESSFGGPEVEKALKKVAEVNDQEWEADKRQWEVSRSLLEHEPELDPVSIVMWMRILAVLGHLANHAENTADLLRLMVARR
ncbi:MAG: TIGR00153 family protein [Gemmatimonadota bacterium]